MSFDTPVRRRIGAEETARGFRLTATAEGPDFIITVSESDQKDLAKAVRTSLGAELASMIIETRQDFEIRGLPLAIPDLKAFIEKQTPKDTLDIKEEI